MKSEFQANQALAQQVSSPIAKAFAAKMAKANEMIKQAEQAKMSFAERLAQMIG